MANQGAKKRREENTRHMNILFRIIIACSVIYLLLRAGFFYSTFTWLHWIGLIVTSAADYLCYNQLASMAKPSDTDDGDLLDGGFDMSNGRACGYIHDVIYITCFVQLTSIISGKFWWIYAVIPGLAVYKGWGLIKEFLPQGSEKAKQVMADEHEKNLIEILEENHPIDINKYTNYVHSPQCGAIATFSGNTRDTFDGKTVVELRYEAYVPMAIRCLNSICSSARSLWNLNAIVVAHRLGPVSVGETSVFVAVSSVHRADALDACKFVIDEIKASVPIWKKEVYSNGEVWKENSEFLERRPEIGKIRVCCKPKVKVEGDEVAVPVKNGCCGLKVKVEDDGSVESCKW